MEITHRCRAAGKASLRRAATPQRLPSEPGSRSQAIAGRKRKPHWWRARLDIGPSDAAQALIAQGCCRNARDRSGTGEQTVEHFDDLDADIGLAQLGNIAQM